MSKQRPDPDKIANELAGASAFFRCEPATPESATDPVPEASSTQDIDAEAVVTSRRPDVTRPAAPALVSFDINRETASHDTLRLALDETRALEELKSSLKWDHDLTVSKNDICRVALHALIEDYRLRGASSTAIKRLRRKLGRH